MRRHRVVVALARVSVLLGVGLTLFGLAGCGALNVLSKAEMLGFSIGWRDRSMANTIWASRNQGRTLRESASFCDFLNNYGVSRSPQLKFNGRLGDAAFNFRFSTIQMAQAAQTSACTAGANGLPVEIFIQSSQGLVVNQPSNSGSMSIKIGNDTFTADHLELTLTSVDEANKHATARFEMLATNHANRQDNRLLIITEGFFSAKF